MSESILKLALRTERDVVQARQRAREFAAALGFDNQDQIRLATATSEIARNAFRYAKEAEVTFAVQLDIPQRMEVTVKDSGPGIPNLPTILEGRYKSDTGLGMGILGTKRLMDDFDIQTSSGGTAARMSKYLPRNGRLLTSQAVAEVTQKMLSRAPESPFQEIERQNQELMKTLQELRTRQDELLLLNRELEDTNRGVVALYAELDERADYLRRASDLKTKFLSNVSHEFRTPLNSIMSLGRMLLDRMDGELTSEQEKQVRYIESSARDLQELVNDLLDLAKVEAGKTQVRSKAFDVHELFSALKGMLRPLLDNSEVELVFEDPENVPTLHTDEGKVSQILRNLVSNALKFTPSGSVTVSCVPAGKTRVLFTVADTGIGIAPEHHETIFREFSQVENPLQERHRGTGLGLPLCRNLAMLLGGRLWLESETGKGSVFFAELPIVFAEPATPEAPWSAEAELYPGTVLIVEDNPEAASLLESYLHHSEYQPVSVRDVTEAGVWLARRTPAAVVVDIDLGKATIRSFLEKLGDRLSGVPIIVVGDAEAIAPAASYGANGFVAKPLNRESVITELRRLTLTNDMRRILIVDDNEVSRYIVREVLDRPWLRIAEASNGSEALRAIHENPPDAVILDLLMPDMSGFQVLRSLRDDSATEFLPVLIYTSKPLSEAEQLELKSLKSKLVPKADIATRLSAQPFLDWLSSEGLSPESKAS